jgi:hypothetical protein
MLAEHGARAYARRPTLLRQVEQALCGRGVLPIAGYSGVGKTTITNKALGLRADYSINNPYFVGRVNYDRVVAVDVSAFGSRPLKEVLYGKLESILPAGQRPGSTEDVSIDRLAEWVRLVRCVLILDNAHVLNRPELREAAERTRAFLRLWAEQTGGEDFPQSKIVLVGSGHEESAFAWLSHRDVTLRANPFSVKPWSSDELGQILEAGCEHIPQLTFAEDAREALIRLSCGLASTFTLLTQFAAQNAAGGDEVPAAGRQVSKGHVERLIQDAGRIVRAVGSSLEMVEHVDRRRSLPELVLLALAGRQGGYVELEQAQDFLRQYDELGPAADQVEAIAGQLADLGLAHSGGDDLILSELLVGSLAMLEILAGGYRYRAELNLRRDVFDAVMAWPDDEYGAPVGEVFAPSPAAGELPARTTGYVFLSYAHKDGTAHVQQLAADLKAQGFDPWWDERIEPGARWGEAIQSAIEQSDVMVVLLTKRAVASTEIEDEWNYARQRGLLLIPVLYPGIKPEAIPIRLRGFQWLDAQTDYTEALRRLIETLRAPRP